MMDNTTMGRCSEGSAEHSAFGINDTQASVRAWGHFAEASGVFSTVLSASAKCCSDDVGKERSSAMLHASGPVAARTLDLVRVRRMSLTVMGCKVTMFAGTASQVRWHASV